MGKRKEADKLVYDCLMIEDEAPLAENTCKYLSLSGIKVAAVSGVEEYREFIRENTARMILLDINLGDGCGYNLCRQIREETQVPIIFVSCQTEEESILLGLNVGGDDFIEKPFDLNVVTAKVQAILRRSYSFQGTLNVMEYHGAVLNLNDATLANGEQKLELTKNEFRILQMLLENAGKIVSRDSIITRLWESDEFIDDNTLTVNIARLRKKLEQIGLEQMIRTKKGIGYMVEQ